MEILLTYTVRVTSTATCLIEESRLKDFGLTPEEIDLVLGKRLPLKSNEAKRDQILQKLVESIHEPQGREYFPWEYNGIDEYKFPISPHGEEIVRIKNDQGNPTFESATTE